MKHRILAIDDVNRDLEALKILLESHGYLVKTTTDIDEGIAYVRQNRGKLSLVMVDFNMPGANGAEVAKMLSDIDPELQIATYSGENSDAAFETTMAAGSRYFIQKGIEPRKTLAIIKTLCSQYEDAHKTVVPAPVTETDLEQLHAIGFAGTSRHLVEIARLVRTFAKDKEVVLIRGENGTGKELVARALHNLSGRRGPFIPINCGALPADLLESELFGHVKGAFTGATSDKKGLLSTASNGTALLDEIGDLPLQLQVKLLRFLQEGEIRPVGSEYTFKVNTRVVAATNVNLEEAIAAGRFRQDLYYRIKVLPIDLLPLRERPEDIRPLVLKLSESIMADMPEKKEFLEETVKMMERFPWPGNIRELEHSIRRMILLSQNGKITKDDFKAVLDKTATTEILDLDYEAFKERQAEEECKYIVKKAQQAGPMSMREFARNVLRTSYATVHGKLKEHGIIFANVNKEGVSHE